VITTNLHGLYQQTVSVNLKF